MLYIKTIRARNNLTQRSLAEMLGVSQQAVAAWESGAKNPRAEDLPKIASVLHCSIDDLFSMAPSA